MSRYASTAWMVAAFIAGIVFTYSCGGGGGGGSTAGGAVSDEDFAALQARVVELESLLTAVSLNASGDLVISGINVYIQSGSGATDGTVNGKGNLIIGYDENDGLDTKTGSHNLVIGPEHTYTSYGGFVAGKNNKIIGISATVSGGEGNSAGGARASINGGAFNFAGGIDASVSGGSSNNAGGNYSSVSGGQANNASGNNSTSAGGWNCDPSADNQWGYGSRIDGGGTCAVTN